MSHAIDLNTDGRELKKLYDAVVSSDPEVTWAVFKYRSRDTVLTPQSTGDGDIDEFIDAFDENAEQFGLVQVDVDTVKKIVLVAWLGDGLPDKLRTGFSTHTSRVARLFPAHQVQLTAHNHDELTPREILSKVGGSSKYAGNGKPIPATKPKFVAAKEGANEDDWGDAKAVEEREEIGIRSNKTTYKPTKADVGSSKSRSSRRDEEDSEEEEQEKGGIQGLDSSSSYKPVGKIDLKAIREAGKKDKFADARIERIESSYKPVGKVDLAAIRAEARKEEQRKIKAEGSAGTLESVRGEEKTVNKEAYKTSYRPDKEEEPEYQSLADRMKAYKDQVNAAKPQFDNDRATSRVSNTASKFGGGAKKLPPHLAAGAVETKAPSLSHAQEAFKDYGSKGGLTPAQLWAEKHGKYKVEDSNEPPVDGAAVEQEEFEEEPQIQRLTVDKKRHEEEEEEKEESEVAFKDLTKKFAGPSKTTSSSSRSVPAPPAEDEDDDVPTPSLPKRQVKEEVVVEDDDEGIVAIAEEEYEEDPNEDNEISIKVGERITHIDKVDVNWWVGRNAAGKTGMFPAEYVRIESASKSEPKGRVETVKDDDESKTAIATFEYTADDEDELSFDKGDLITNVTFPDKDWWSGEFNGKVGLFPAAYVELN